MIHVSRHACERALERIDGLRSMDEAHDFLAQAVFARAATFAGRHTAYVRLGTGQRIVIIDGSVVTVLPADHFGRQVKRIGLGRYGRGCEARKGGNCYAID